MRQEWLLCRLRKWSRAGREKVVRQGRRRVLLHGIRRNGLPISSAFRIRTAAVYLEIGIWLLAIQNRTRALRHIGVDHGLAARGRHHMRLSIWRIQIGLALLEMLDLPRRILGPYEATVLAPDLVAFGGRFCILKLYEGTANVRICVSTHRSWR